MNFSLWLENTENNRNHWEQFFLGIWSLDKTQDGLSKNLKGFDTNRLVQTSEFQSLNPYQQQEIINRIIQGNGTVGDLVDIASGME